MVELVVVVMCGGLFFFILFFFWSTARLGVYYNVLITASFCPYCAAALWFVVS